MSENNGRMVRVRPGDIVGSAEAADILGVERTRIARYRRTGVMPTPWDELRATPVWLRRDVEKVAAKRAEHDAAAEAKRAEREAA